QSRLPRAARFVCFQAEAGIRDRNVTGVQTCALPISVQEALIGQVAEVTGLELLMEKAVPPAQIHRTWTVWRSQHESATSEVRSLLSSVDAAVAERFVDRLLGELIRARGGQELLATLQAFISAGGARERIAAEIGIHRH